MLLAANKIRHLPKKTLTLFCWATICAFGAPWQANAELVRHSDNLAIQKKIQQLPALGTLDGAPVVAPMPAPLSTLPQYVPSAPIDLNQIVRPMGAPIGAPIPQILAKPVPQIARPVPPSVARPTVAPVALPAMLPSESINGAVVMQSQLSPKTKNMLAELPAKMGESKESVAKIEVTKGKFAPIEEGEFEDSGDELEKIEAAPALPNIELTVSDDPNPRKSDYELLEKAEKALDYEQYEAAITLYRGVLDKMPEHRDALLGMALAYQKTGRATRAKEIYRQILTKHPDFAPAINNLLALAAEEAPESALQQFAELEKKSPNFAPIYAQKAQVCLKLGDVPTATQSLIKALELDDENQNYRYNLALIYDKNKNYNAAVPLYYDLIAAADSGKEIPVDKEKLLERMNYISTLK